MTYGLQRSSLDGLCPCYTTRFSRQLIQHNFSRTPYIPGDAGVVFESGYLIAMGAPRGVAFGAIIPFPLPKGWRWALRLFFSYGASWCYPDDEPEFIHRTPPSAA